MKLDGKLLRIMDANINRATEGLRVVEEITRFILDNGQITEKLKSSRHCLTNIVKACVADYFELLDARDSEADVGANIHNSTENKRKDIEEILVANMKRSQEALRVLEEFSKIDCADAFLLFKKLRYELYSLEKEIINLIRKKSQ